MVPLGDGTGPAGLGPGKGRGRGRGGCGRGNRQNAGGWRNVLTMFRRPKSEPVLPTKLPADGGRTVFAVVDGQRCTHCGICVDVCPTGAISFSPEETLVHREACTGCGQCVRTCPKDAITLVER